MNTEESVLKSSLLPLLKNAWQLKWILIPLGALIASGTWYLTKKTGEDLSSIRSVDHRSRGTSLSPV